ncbi:hypothetical protein M8C21_020142 [Ambrosia artemisiifolia]|uniref:Uncharacterized protein n=1 Tax=Ambrosia artemisiifolia TaxID=4212 RepID=A0AAD5CF43_AMBAR|nr:hypothetical protein M8C21_020142 [Ambrosia artemisiifolia]
MILISVRIVEVSRYASMCKSVVGVATLVNLVIYMGARQTTRDCSYDQNMQNEATQLMVMDANPPLRCSEILVKVRSWRQSGEHPLVVVWYGGNAPSSSAVFDKIHQKTGCVMIGIWGSLAPALKKHLQHTLRGGL